MANRYTSGVAISARPLNAVLGIAGCTPTNVRPYAAEATEHRTGAHLNVEKNSILRTATGVHSVCIVNDGQSIRGVSLPLAGLNLRDPQYSTLSADVVSQTVQAASLAARTQTIGDATVAGGWNLNATKLAPS